MHPWKRYPRIVYFLVLVLALIALLHQASAPAFAYITAQKWQNVASINYGIDPNLDANLITGATNIINENVHFQWDKASWFTRTQVAYDPNSNGITTLDLLRFPPPGCGGGMVPDDPAVTCNEFAGPNTMLRSRTYMNTSGSWIWNTSGTMYCTNSPGSVDVRIVSLHELGHWSRLLHDPAHQEAVMWPDCISNTKQVLWQDDDKQAVTQIYGPRTSWEPTVAYAIGLVNTIDYSRSVAGYFNNNNPPPELGVRSQEFGVPVFTGVQYEMLAGYAQAPYSYIYNTLFTYANDNNPAPVGNRSYLTITAGMRVRWFEYNYQRSTMGIDFEMTDGSTLRNSGLRDTNNVPVHPAGRGVYPTGQWFYTEIDLSPLAGKTIQKWWIAYDNGNNGQTGQFRAYFDNFRVQY